MKHLCAFLLKKVMDHSIQPRPLLDYTPADGSLTPLMSGIEWLRLPLPFALNHVNIWLLEGNNDGACATIDAGFPLPENKEAWTQALGARRLNNIFITHCHPDHLGLAGWLSNQFPDASCYLTAHEEKLARALSDDVTLSAWLPTHISAYQAAGLDETRMTAMLKRMSGYKHVVTPLPSVFTTVKNDDTLMLGGRRWIILEGFGHSPEHASLYCDEDDIFIAGDMVLPYISPNISLSPRDQPDADPLAGYLDSLARIKAQVPDTALVLPSHGVPFHGLHARIDTLTQHHYERCLEITAILSDGSHTAVALMEKMFAHRKLDANTLFFALGETMAHLRYMQRRGEISQETAADGVTHYRSV